MEEEVGEFCGLSAHAPTMPMAKGEDRRMEKVLIIFAVKPLNAPLRPSVRMIRSRRVRSWFRRIRRRMFAGRLLVFPASADVTGVEDGRA